MLQRGLRVCSHWQSSVDGAQFESRYRRKLLLRQRLAELRKVRKALHLESGAVRLPEGWRLPTHADFRELEKNAVGIDSGNAASVLKSSEWEPSGKKNGFNAIPAGYGFYTFRFYQYIKEKKMDFISLLGTSMFWSSTGSDSIAELWYLTRGEDKFFYSRSSFMSYGLFVLPVRCIKNDSNIAVLSKSDSVAILEKMRLVE